MTARDVAQWMVAQIDDRYMYQEVIVHQIRQHWGDDYVYLNANGNLAISKAVLKEFRALTDGAVVWERGERAWRKSRPGENRRAAD